MNVKRFTAKNSRDALALVRQALGEDAVVLSTRPGGDGVEVLAMAPDGLQQIEQAASNAPTVRAQAAAPGRGQPQRPAQAEPRAPRVPNSVGGQVGADADLRAARAAEHQIPALRQDAAPQRGRSAEPKPTLAQRAARERIEPRMDGGIDAGVEKDVEALGMSTLTFQDYVRERMLKRRQAEIDQGHTPAPAMHAEAPARRAAPAAAPAPQAAPRREIPVLRDEVRLAEPEPPVRLDNSAQRERSEMLGELRSMKHLIEERFGMLAFMEKLQRNPRQAELSQKLLDSGLSPALIRKLVQSLPADTDDEMAWAASVLERNVLTDERDAPIEDQGGVYALIGSTGVGKTTSTAKIAAAFATKHGAANLGLITLDAYRVAAHEQLRTYGRILGVPVHTAHDRASLEDLLELLSAKKMVLIDTAGMAQRDSRTRELMEMLSHRSIQKLLVVNAAAQGETVEDVMTAYGAASCRGIVISKLDEAVKLGPALDAVIRHKCKVVGIANGQRVPEDWHRLSAQALVQRALRGGGGSSWRLDAGEVNLIFAGRHAVTSAAVHA
ncbi:flagellar biosynthesis protein FlhF [Aquabacterium sp.]|uniref:flagellar biosynthesis protein FlhF n=1 Tax=Aquabacterium sp. TaxID=1872578 RepID=UPI002C8637AB|nr:flagellar biosynthesis protein FlhF [Aquabacterium sp.]HSW05111.1 flagellar biosynthesis protein FlhF [Aquabacterium sp.]